MIWLIETGLSRVPKVTRPPLLIVLFSIRLRSPPMEIYPPFIVQLETILSLPAAMLMPEPTVQLSSALPLPNDTPPWIVELSTELLFWRPMFPWSAVPTSQFKTRLPLPPPRLPVNVQSRASQYEPSASWPPLQLLTLLPSPTARPSVKVIPVTWLPCPH